MEMDITKEIQQVLRNASQTWGDDFFRKMTQNLGSIIEADYIFIGKINSKKNGVNTLGLWGKEGHMDDFNYDLNFTPCQNVANDSICCYPDNVTSLFPKDELLIQMSIEGYIGTPLKNSRGEVFALMIALFKKEITHKDYVIALFEVFAGRISAELEREERERQLHKMNLNLELLVEERTSELEKLLVEVTETRKILMEQEKIASLGTLVAGVAHEVNTPLGVTITAASTIKENIQSLEKSFHNNNLKKSELEGFISQMNKSYELIINNLNRSASLINNFKKIAVDQSSGEIRQIFLKHYIDDIMISLLPLTEKRGIHIDNDVQKDISMTVDVGAIYQIFTNLLMNAFIHGFNEGSGYVQIKSETNDNHIIISVINDGKPINESIKDRIFEPFITSNRANGGSGLGLHIVYNLVTSKLNGRILLAHSDTPVCFQIIIDYK